MTLSKAQHTAYTNVGMNEALYGGCQSLMTPFFLYPDPSWEQPRMLPCRFVASGMENSPVRIDRKSVV